MNELAGIYIGPYHTDKWIAYLPIASMAWVSKDLEHLMTVSKTKARNLLRSQNCKIVWDDISKINKTEFSYFLDADKTNNWGAFENYIGELR